MLLRKQLKLPTPFELGWTDHEHSCLGIRSITPFQEGKTWEDYEEYCRANYPVRFWISDAAETVVSWGRWVSRRFGNFFYWFRCRFIPGNQWHLVDLRGVDPLTDYRWGYLEPQDQMLLACFAALRLFVEKNQPWDPGDRLAELLKPDVEPADNWEVPHLVRQKRQYDDTMEIYRWWTEGRKAEEAEDSRLFEAFEETKRQALAAIKTNGTADRAEYDAASKAWRDYCAWREQNEEEMLLRLVRLRGYLWT